MTKDEAMAVMKAQQSIFITYINETTDDGQILTRMIDPYVLGYTRKGKLAIRAYQRFGASHTAPLGWRIFLLNNIQRWEIRGDMPTTAPTDYRANGDDDLRVIYQQPNPLVPVEQPKKGGILYPLLDLINKIKKKIRK